MGHLLGERIKELRERKGLSKRKLEKEAVISRGYLSRIEAGKRTNLGRDMIQRLASGLGAKMIDIYREDEPSKEQIEAIEDPELRAAVQFAAGWIPSEVVAAWAEQQAHSGRRAVKRRLYLAELEAYFEMWKSDRPEARDRAFEARPRRRGSK
jgi:transcriptional regulator with XRE-family HTH domain